MTENSFHLTAPLSDRDRYWLMAPLHGVRRPQLLKMLEAMPDGGASCPGKGRGRTIPIIKAHIQAARAEYWNGSAPHKHAPLSESLCRISATEVNTWLRSLPPADFGEAI